MLLYCEADCKDGRFSTELFQLSVASDTAKRRYMDKLKLHVAEGADPYEVPKNEWKDDIDLWPAITHVHVCMYLILSPSPYSDKDMLNYKSLDSYQSFVKGWVRQVLVMLVGEKHIMIGKDSTQYL